MREGDVAFVMVRVARLDESPEMGRTAVCEIYDGESKRVISGELSYIHADALLSPTAVAQRVMAKLGEPR